MIDERRGYLDTIKDLGVPGVRAVKDNLESVQLEIEDLEAKLETLMFEEMQLQQKTLRIDTVINTLKHFSQIIEPKNNSMVVVSSDDFVANIKQTITSCTNKLVIISDNMHAIQAQGGWDSYWSKSKYLKSLEKEQSNIKVEIEKGALQVEQLAEKIKINFNDINKMNDNLESKLDIYIKTNQTTIADLSTLIKDQED